ncbi:DUF6537 domain-containing protein, partial [Mesorhizobium sp. CAU 1732]|uniref:DUF6537 domain-containing protein n=1 Tax=Mesorhizobium sp. CAU 1732 TaxID=3140358 RepID=UPI0032606A50
MERRLIVGYEKLVDEVLERLTADNHAAAVKLLSLADMVRGYGPVKEAAAASYEDKVTGVALEFFNAPSSGKRPVAAELAS